MDMTSEIHVWSGHISWVQNADVNRVTSMLMTVYSVYTILLLRYHVLFEDQCNEISQNSTLYVYIINVMVTLIMIIPLFLQYDVTLYVFLLWTILLIMSYIHLLYAFNHNLYLLVLSHEKKELKSAREITIIRNIQFWDVLWFLVIYVMYFKLFYMFYMRRMISTYLPIIYR